MSWCFGFNKHIEVLNLCVNDSKKIFEASSHIGVVYDFETNTQTLLQGHVCLTLLNDMLLNPHRNFALFVFFKRNTISCCTISDDKRWLVTADAGQDSTIIVWDLNSK